MTTEIQKIHKGEITLNDVQDKIIIIQNKNALSVSTGFDVRKHNKRIRKAIPAKLFE